MYFFKLYLTIQIKYRTFTWFLKHKPYEALTIRKIFTTTD